MAQSDGPGGKAGEKVRKVKPSFKPQLPPVPNSLGQKAKPKITPQMSAAVVPPTPRVSKKYLRND
jgi:hypothetical protein